MVLEEGRKNGIGIWDVNNYRQIHERIESIVSTYISSNVDFDMVLEEILIVGSYGAGMGIRGKSDLDLMIIIGSSKDSRSTELSQTMRDIAETVNYNEDKILDGFDAFDGLEAYVYPFLEKDKQLANLCEHEPIETYYNLTQDKKRSYY